MAGPPAGYEEVPAPGVSGPPPGYEEVAAPTRPDFSANPPGVPKPSVDMKEHYLIGGEEKQPLGEQIAGIGGDMAKSAYQVSAPGIAASISHANLPGPLAPAPLKELPNQIMGTALPLMAGADELPDSEVSAPKAIEGPSKPGIGSRLLEVGKRRAGHIPGVQAIKDANYVLRGPTEAPEPPQTLSHSPSPTVAGPQPTQPEPTVPQSKTAVGKKIESGLNEGLGGKPLQPNVPLRSQGPSSAVDDFSYDPVKKELTVKAKDGIGHVYGEITPEQADAFEKASSKGKAWKDIRDNNVKVAKISPDGTRTPNKGAVQFRSASPEIGSPAGPDDLEQKLRDSLALVKKKKPQ